MSEDAATVAELIYRRESLGFHVDDDESGDLRKLCEGLAAPLEEVYELVRPREDMAGWAVLYDPDLCPAKYLPWLAQHVGVVVTPEMTEAQIRAEIKQPTGWRRGQTESIKVAIRRTLKSVGEEPLIVIIRPNTPGNGQEYIRTLLSQTPDPARTATVARAVTPAWNVIDYAAIEGLKYADIRAAFPTYKALREAVANYGDLRELLPSELPEP